MAKLIGLDDAAVQLGMTPEEVTEARTKNQLFGYRDGVNWKFKETELERFASSKGIVLGNPEIKKSGSSGSLPKISAFDEDLTELVDVSDLELSEADDDQDSSEPDSILVSEEELGSSEPSAGSTIIGKEQLGEDADLILSGGSSGSQIKLAGDSAGASDLILGGDSDGSAIKLAGDSEIKLEGGVSGGSELKLASDSAGSNMMAGAKARNAGSKEGDDDVILDGDDLTLEGDDLKLEGDGGLELSDDELILDDDSVSSLDFDGDEINLLDSDITLNASDSGINLASPSDSGISLENTPAELGGSGIEALELGEADFIELDDDNDLDLEGGTTLQADDDFLLTSADGGRSGDESESGSQVIALDEADEFDEVGDTMLVDADMLDADSMDADDLGADDSAYTAGSTGVAAATIAAPVDAEYSIWNVIGLGTCLFLLSLSGIMMFDLLRNMWSWGQEYSLNSTLMNAILGLFP